MRAARTKTERRPGALPRQRDATSVTAEPEFGVAEELRVLHVLGGDVEHLGKSEFFTLIDVGRTGQSEEHRGERVRTCGSQCNVDLRGESVLAVPVEEVGDLRKSETRDVTDDVVVVLNPRCRSACLGCCLEVVLRDALGFLGVPACAEHVEVEALAEPLLAGVGGAAVGVDPRLGNAHARRVVLVENAAPRRVNFVDLVAIEQVVGAVVLHDRHVVRRALRQVTIRQVLDEGVSNVDAEAVDSAVTPELNRLLEVGADLGVVPVPVRLFRREQVHVPLTGGAVRFGDARPRGRAEVARQFAGSDLAVRALAVAEDVTVALGRTGSRLERLLEPHVVGPAVVGDDIDDEADLRLVKFVNQLVEFGQRADARVDVAVVVHVVATVSERRGIERAHPHRINTERCEVRNFGDDSAKVTDSVAVGVLERTGIDLVHDGLTPPVFVSLEEGEIGHTEVPCVVVDERGNLRNLAILSDGLGRNLAVNHPCNDGDERVRGKSSQHDRK